MNFFKACMAVSFGCCLCAPGQLVASEWDYQLEPYLMVTTIEGDAGIGRVNSPDINVDFDTILENLNSAAMVHFEALHSNGWGFVVDYGFMDLRADISGPRDGVIDARLRQGILQVEVMRRVELGDGHLDYSAGVRWWDNDIEVEIDPALLPIDLRAEVKEDWVDVFVGLRWITPVSDSWNLMLRGDVGGFGQEADLTWGLAAGFQYDINDNMAIDVFYRGTWVDYETGSKGQPDYFLYDTITHGPVFGFIYKF